MVLVCRHEVFVLLLSRLVRPPKILPLLPVDMRFPMTKGLLVKAGLLAREELPAIGGLLVVREGNSLAKDHGCGVWAGVIGSMLDDDPPTTKALARLSQGLHCVPGSPFIRFWTSIGSASSHSYF